MTQAVQIDCVTVGPLGVNAYIVFRSGDQDALLIDPGDEAGRILNRAALLGVDIRAVLLTHAHLDHWAALPDILEKKRCRFFFIRLISFSLGMRLIKTWLNLWAGKWQIFRLNQWNLDP